MSDAVLMDSAKRVEQTGYVAWVVCLSAGLFFLYEFFQLICFDVINPSLRRDFGLTAAQLSWLSSAYMTANTLFLLPAGWLLDRFSTRIIILAAMSLCLIGTVGFSLSHQVVLAYFFHFLAGIGNAFCFLACVVLVSRWFPLQRQGLVIGWIVTMAFTGGLLAHAPLAYLNSQLGWRGALWIDAAVGGCILVWLGFILRDKPPGSAPLLVSPSVGVLCVDYRQTLLPGVYTACMNLPMMVLCALWGSSYLHAVHGVSLLSASYLASLVFLGSMLGCPLLGWLSDRLQRRKPLMVIGVLATGLLSLLLLSSQPLSLQGLAWIFFMLGFFTSAQVISYPLVAESQPEHAVGFALGLASVIIMGGGGLGQIAFGALIQSSVGGAHAADHFQYAMGLFPVASALALLALMLTRETYCQRVRSGGNGND